MQNSHPAGLINGIDAEQYVIVLFFIFKEVLTKFMSRQTKASDEGRDIKPLPPLPRGWARVTHETGLFLRSIGLGIVVSAFQGFFSKSFRESEKVAIRRSRVTALLRALIHAVPLSIAIFEIVINWKGHYVGAKFDMQNSLQFVAKGHEVTMQASIAAVLLSYIRYQISAGEGMPFGAVLGGLQFLQISYLWSIELWSSILATNFRLRRKIPFVVLILVGVILAATAGPSSANLLIARRGIWPQNPTYYAVNATVPDMWPDRVDGENIPKDCSRTRQFNSTAGCPLSAIDVFLSTAHESNKNSELNSEGLNVLNFGDQYALQMLMSHCPISSTGQICATVPQQGLMDGLIEEETGEFPNALEGYRIIKENYYQPYTVASCVGDTIRIDADQTPLLFPRISETPAEIKRGREIVSVPGITKGQVMNGLSISKSQFLVAWIDLPQDIFNTGVPGALVVHPRAANNSSHNITTCTLNAGWGSSAIMNDFSVSDIIRSQIFGTPSSWYVKRVSSDAFGYLISSFPNFAQMSNFTYPQRRIRVSKSWMEFLNPDFVSINNSTTPLMSRWLSSLDQAGERDLARMFSIFLTLGLSTTGMGHDWKGLYLPSIRILVHTMKELSLTTLTKALPNITRTATDQCKSCLLFEVDHSLLGWLYAPHGASIKLAIANMFLYCILVLGHIIYSAVTGISSTAWDSAAELVALAMNSSQTQVLQNTCAGIIGRRALMSPVRVLVQEPGHLELVFGNVSKDENIQNGTKLVVNQQYGKLAASEDGRTNHNPKQPEPTCKKCYRKQD